MVDRPNVKRLRFIRTSPQRMAETAANDHSSPRHIRLLCLVDADKKIHVNFVLHYYRFVFPVAVKTCQ